MEYEIRPLQLRVLEVLKGIDKVCREHKLRYYIMAGTLLGAVRHGGFIPWDDDLDIAMPRRDYDLLLRHASEWLPAPLEAVAAETDPTYPLPFAKIQDASTTLVERAHLRYLGGIYVDVFPLDGVPDGMLARRWHFARYEFYKRAIYLVHRDPYKHGHGPSSWLPLLVRKLYTLTELQRKISKLMKKYDFDVSEHVADFDDGLHGAMPRTWIGEASNISFEGCNVKTIAHPELYLKRKYGDYMTIPPASKQRQHHFHYLDLTTPYRRHLR